LKIFLDEDQEDPEDPPTKIDENDPTAGPELQAVERTHSKRLKSDARDDFTEEDETTVSQKLLKHFD